MRILPILLAAVLATSILAGCSSKTAASFDPYDFPGVTGRMIHLKMTVVDLIGQEIYPGMAANLWAFCAQPASPTDAVSAAAIEYWNPLPGDGLVGGVTGNELQGKCSVPGPTIRVQQGDHVIVDFTHSHFHAHTIHWHGQFVPYLSDGAPGVSQGVIQGGESFTYDFIAKKAGTLWYHCHVDTQLHLMQGLYGMFIVDPPAGKDAPAAEDIPTDHEYVMVMGGLKRGLVESVPGVSPHRHKPGCLVSGTPNCQNPPVDTESDTFILNGHSYPDTMHQTQADGKLGTLITMAEGEAIRIRLLNAGDNFEVFHPHGHDMLVVARDGTPLSSPYWVDSLSVGPSERYDVVMYGRNPGVWMAHTHVDTHETNDKMSCGGLHTMVVYKGFESKMHQFDNDSCLPGGLPYTRDPQAISADAYNSTLAKGVTGNAGDGEPKIVLNVPVEEPCAVRAIHVTVTANSASAVTQGLNKVLVDVANQKGDLVTPARLDMGAKTFLNYTLGPKDIGLVANLPPGDVKVTVHGTLVQTDVTIDSFVDYFESYEQAKQNSHLANYTDCLLVPER